MNPIRNLARSSTRRSGLDAPQSDAVGVRRDEVDGDDMDIGDAIRANLLKLRRERGLSLARLAELAGMNPSTLDDLASGKSFPSVELLWKLARALDVPCTAFIEEPAMVTMLSVPSATRTTFA